MRNRREPDSQESLVSFATALVALPLAAAEELSSHQGSAALTVQVAWEPPTHGSSTQQNAAASATIAWGRTLQLTTKKQARLHRAN